jgi:ABC-type polysaccharide/polyol phosphate export permease
MRSGLNFAIRLYRHRSLVAAMALRDVQTRYAGTLAGLVWSLVHPLLIVLIYWFVFTKGLKVSTAGNMPFILVFLSGFAPWTAFAESIGASTTSIMSNPHLVKKTRFPTEILPVVCFLSSLMGHAVMLVMLLTAMVVNGQGLGLLNLQFIYFLGAMSLLCIGLGWLVSALNVFCRDVGQAVTVALSMWFWLTPIVWDAKMIEGRWAWLIRLNPMFHIVEGYRRSFLHHSPLWSDWREAAFFWVFVLLVLVVGGVLFRRLKGEFAEVL